MRATEKQQRWVEAWLDAVVDGRATMSQRNAGTIETRGGGLANVTAVAEAKGVHLIELVDDQGHVLICASKHPFRVLC